MITIKEYLGSLVIGINQARLLADQESANIAKLYASDELLRYFASPRFRIADLELHIPMAMGRLKTRIEKDYKPFESDEISLQIVDKLIALAQLEQLDELTKRALTSTIDLQVELLENRMSGGETIERSIPAFSKAVVQQFIWLIEMQRQLDLYLKERKSKKEDVITSLEQQLSSFLTPLVRIPKQVVDMEESSMIVEASKLKEVAVENRIQIKMRLNEEGMEWHTMEGIDGNVQTKLVPE